MIFANTFSSLILLLPVYSMMTSCATLGGRTQPVAIDTAPRGVSVAINAPAQPEDPRTPLALNVSRGHALELEYHHDAYRRKIEVGCKVRFGTVFGGNLPLGLLAVSEPLSALLVYGTAVGLDFLTGAAFECPNHIQHTLSVPEALQEHIPNKCARVLIHFPDIEPDLSLKAALVEEAKSFAKRVEQECVEFVPASVSADALQRSMLETVSVKQIFNAEMGFKLSQLLRDTGAVKAIEMRIEQQTDSVVTVSFSLWDLYSKEAENTYRKNFKREKFEKLKGGVVSQFLGRSLKLLPNSIALSASNPSLTLANNIPTQSQRTSGKSSLFGLVSVASVQHPNQYDAWDAGFQFGPSLYIDSISHEVRVDRELASRAEIAALSEKDQQTRIFRAFALTVPFDAVISFHTPAGAFRLFLGYGPMAYFPTSKSADSLDERYLGASHAGLDWVAYFSDNIFFQVGAHAISRAKSPIDEQGAFRLMGWEAASLGVGYYFPATAGYVESLLSQKNQ
jgi:hypothetical protein